MVMPIITQQRAILTTFDLLTSEVSGLFEG